MVEISEREGSRIITMKAEDGKREYAAPYETRIIVANGDKVPLGVPLPKAALIRTISSGY